MQKLGKWRFAALFAGTVWAVLVGVGALLVLYRPWGLVTVVGLVGSVLLYCIGLAVYSDAYGGDVR